MFYLLFLFVITANVFSEGWDPRNNPSVIVPNLNQNLAELPVVGQLNDQRLGWPGSHWASYVGGIAHRWSAGNPQNFTYKLLSLSDLKNLEPHEINELSPAEKFDIFNGNYHYPTVKKVFKTVSPYENQWHGICHGYAPAALNHPEPASITFVNKDGIKLHFYSSDVAGLMSFYYAKVVYTPVKLIGTRCNYNSGSRFSTNSQVACDDMNAGAFHLVMANKLGLEGTGFIADIDRYIEVWNHIAVSYTSTYKNESTPIKTSAKGAVKRIEVETIVTFAAAIAPKFDPVLNTEAAEYAQQSYSYFLDLDKYGDVLGGEWISEARPDFIWTQKKAIFNQNWESLDRIYSPAM
jgi:hypothetical protein